MTSIDHAVTPASPRVPGKRSLSVPAVGLVPSSDTAQRGLTRLALDLHDGPLQDMAAAGFGLNLLERMLTELPSDTTEATAQLGEIRRELGAVEATLRELAARPGSAEAQESVVEMLDRELARFRSRCTAIVELDLVGEIEPETTSQRILLHRVLREALTNVARHAQATEVRISLIDTGDVIYLRIVDNGVGFQPAGAGDVEGRTRLGLTGMRRRLEMLDGTLSVETKPGGPTSLTAGIKRWRPPSSAPSLAS